VGKKFLGFGNEIDNYINMELGNVRVAAVSGMFYPGDEKSLKKMIFECLDKAELKSLDGELKAVISPHAGYIYSAPVAAYSYKLFKKIDQKKKWKILLLGPSHRIPFQGAAAPAFGKWETPLGLVEVKDVRDEIGESKVIDDVPEAGVQEHSLEVQVPFLQMVLDDFELYPLVLGDVRAEDLAKDLADFCKNEDVIVVVSTDLSHYLPYEEAQEVDGETCEAVSGLDIEKMKSKGDACGRAGVLTLMYLAKKLGWKCELLDYKNSGDTAGGKDQVVGYGAWGFYK
jgi:hypothetical protein